MVGDLSLLIYIHFLCRAISSIFQHFDNHPWAVGTWHGRFSACGNGFTPPFRVVGAQHIGGHRVFPVACHLGVGDKVCLVSSSWTRMVWITRITQAGCSLDGLFEMLTWEVYLTNWFFWCLLERVLFTSSPLCLDVNLTPMMEPHGGSEMSAGHDMRHEMFFST